VLPLSVTHIEDCPDLGPQCNGLVKPTPYYHHVDEVVTDTSLYTSLALTHSFAIDTKWSVRATHVDPTYSELDGTPKLVPNDIHHHHETVGGVTDPWLLARWSTGARHIVTDARLGLSFPVGNTVPDPEILGREGKWHEHLQDGSGTFIPIVGWGLSLAFAPVTITLDGTGLFNLYANEKGYEAPVRVYASHRIAVSLLRGAVTPAAEVTLLHEGEEYWHDQLGDAGSNVRTELYVGGALAWQFYGAWSLEGRASGRALSVAAAPTFKSGGIFSLGVSTRIDLWKPRPASSSSSPHVRETRHDSVVEFEKD
jgi:hypothetical protein